MDFRWRDHDILLIDVAKHRIILDCDPGIDDAVAIMLALSSPEIEMLGITCVAGNVGATRTASNAARIRNLMGRSDVPVYRGLENTLTGEPMRSAIVHGKDGLGDIGISRLNTLPNDGHAVDFIIRTIMDEPKHTVTLCVIGPMTNVAVAFRREPRLPKRLKRLLFMGGVAFSSGNTTRKAEFNIHCDPHAASVVVGSGVDTSMFGLDVTRRMQIDGTSLAALANAPTGNAAELAYKLLTAYGRKDPSLHDPCVIASLIDPTIFKSVSGLIHVECTDRDRFGETNVEPGEGANIITDGDRDRLFALLSDRLQKARIAPYE